MKRKKKASPEEHVTMPTGRPGKIVSVPVDAAILEYYHRLSTLAAITTEEAMRTVLAMHVINSQMAAKNL